MPNELAPCTLPGEHLNLLFSADAIAQRVAALGRRITATYQGESLVCICVLRGAVVFFSDLIRCIDLARLEIDFLRLSSYHDATKSSGDVEIAQWLSCDLTQKHVLVVEDIIDTGRSMQVLWQHLSGVPCRSLRLAAFIDKKERRTCHVQVDFSCFDISSGFLVGYGLDYAERYRQLPALYELTFEKAEK